MKLNLSQAAMDLQLNKIKKIISNKNIKTDFYRMQANDSIKCGYFCIAFSDFMLKHRVLFNYANPFCPNKYEKNDEIILESFQQL